MRFGDRPSESLGKRWEHQEFGTRIESLQAFVAALCHNVDPGAQAERIYSPAEAFRERFSSHNQIRRIRPEMPDDVINLDDTSAILVPLVSADVEDEWRNRFGAMESGSSVAKARQGLAKERSALIRVYRGEWVVQAIIDHGDCIVRNLRKTTEIVSSRCGHAGNMLRTGKVIENYPLQYLAGRRHTVLRKLVEG